MLLIVFVLGVGFAHDACVVIVEVAVWMTFFDELSIKNVGVCVIHFQVDINVIFASTVNIGLGWSMDVVMGAMLVTFDVVSSVIKFSDNCYLFHGGVGFERSDSGISFSGVYAFESDYRFVVVSGITHHDLYEYNFTLVFVYSHNFDSVCDADNIVVVGQLLNLVVLSSSVGCFSSTFGIVIRKLNIDTFEPSLSWTMILWLVVQLGAMIQILDGFQSNLYRKVLVGSQNRTFQERLFEFRQRYAVFVWLVYVFSELWVSILVMIRGYDDSWYVRAFIVDVVGTKYLGQSMLFSVCAHYHIQGGASFYRDVIGYQTLGLFGQYWIGDRELSLMGNYLFGGKLAFFRRPQQERSSWFVEMELGAKYELLLYRFESLFVLNVDRTYAHIVQGAFAMRFQSFCVEGAVCDYCFFRQL